MARMTKKNSRLPLYAFLLLPLLLGGCALLNRENSKVTPPHAGKIHIRYQYTSADETNPPAAFNVYRSPEFVGPFQKLNTKPIQANSDPETGRVQLLLTDKETTLGENYYYYVEKRTEDGKWQKATGVARAQAVLPLLEKKPAREPEKE